MLAIFAPSLEFCDDDSSQTTRLQQLRPNCNNICLCKGTGGWVNVKTVIHYLGKIEYRVV